MTVSIPEGGKKEVTVRLPEPREALAVTVVDARDWPVDAAQVSASSLDAAAPLRTTAFTDERGEATLKRARGVPLRVEVSAPGHAPKVADDGRRGRVAEGGALARRARHRRGRRRRAGATRSPARR